MNQPNQDQLTPDDLPPIGSRIGAIAMAFAGEVGLLGYGVYEGDFVPEEAAGDLADILKLTQKTVPRLRLDNGAVVYSVECWWGPQERVEEFVSKRHVRHIELPALRMRAQLRQVPTYIKPVNAAH